MTEWYLRQWLTIWCLDSKVKWFLLLRQQVFHFEKPINLLTFTRINWNLVDIYLKVNKICNKTRLSAVNTDYIDRKNTFYIFNRIGVGWPGNMYKEVPRDHDQTIEEKFNILSQFVAADQLKQLQVADRVIICYVICEESFLHIFLLPLSQYFLLFSSIFLF